MEAFTRNKTGDTIGFTFSANLGDFHGLAAGTVARSLGFNAICSHDHPTASAAKTCARKMAKAARADLTAYHARAVAA